jgi:acyl carrier protein
VGTDQSTALAVISQFLKRANKAQDGLTDDTGLWGDGLGLDSLEAAELSAMLEDEFGSDPFTSEAEMPERVGDILAFYEATDRE